MADWRDKLRPGSFRGVPFKVEQHAGQGGRRTQRHELLNRNLPFIEDLGRRGRAYRFNAYVIGDDFMEQGDALLAACEQSGPGLLVHPYHGRVLAACVDVTWRTGKGLGRLYVFDLVFEETGAAPAGPSRSVDQRGAAEAAAEAASAAVTDDLAGSLEVEGVPEYVLQAPAEELSRIGTILRELDVFTGPAQEVATVQALAQVLIDQAGPLVLAPVNLAVQIRTTLEAVRFAAANFVDSLAAYEQLFGLERTESSPGLTPFDLVADRNRDALLRSVRVLAASEAVMAAVAASWESRDEAIAARVTIADELDAVAGLADLPDALFSAVQDLRARLVFAVPPSTEDLPVLARITPAVTLPAHVLAYWLYGDPRRDEEIIARNRIRHPLFVPAGEALTVLSES